MIMAVMVPGVVVRDPVAVAQVVAMAEKELEWEIESVGTDSIGRMNVAGEEEDLTCTVDVH